MLDRGPSESAKPRVERRVQQLRNQFPPRTIGIAPMGHASQPNKVSSERRWRSRDRRETFAEQRRGIDHRKRDSNGPMIPPCPAGFVQESLERDRLFVPDVIDPANARPQDRRFNSAQVVRGREKLKQRGFSPDAQQATPCEPARRLDHQNATPVDQAEAKSDGTGAGVLRPLEEESFLVQSGPGMHRDRLAIESSLSPVGLRRSALPHAETKSE